MLSLLPPSVETPILLIGPVIALVVLLALPFCLGRRRKELEATPHRGSDDSADGGHTGHFHPSGRLYSVESRDGRVERRSDSCPIPERADGTGTARRARFSGQAVPQLPRLGGVGGQRGPALDRVAVRLTGDQLIRQVIQGGGNMPAYGKNLSPAETTALVAFLRRCTRRTAPARDASRDVTVAVSDRGTR